MMLVSDISVMFIIGKGYYIRRLKRPNICQKVRKINSFFEEKETSMILFFKLVMRQSDFFFPPPFIRHSELQIFSTYIIEIEISIEIMVYGFYFSSAK